jgi:hypothetical protein
VSRRNPEPRWPLWPLLRAAKVTQEDLLRRVGESTSAVYWANRYGLTEKQADEWSLRCGLMPHEVWDGWFDAALTENDRAFLNNGWRPAWLWLEATREADPALVEPSYLPVTMPPVSDGEQAA